MSNTQVLIVEDEAITAMDIQSILEEIGYQVIGIADNSLEAFSFLEQSFPDLIIMDIAIKGTINGSQLALNIKNQFNIPIIFLTAYQDDNTFKEAKASDPYGYLPKPFDKRELRIAAELAIYKHEINTKLIESERRFHNAFFFAATGMALVPLNKEEPFLQVNKSLCTMLGYKEKELLHLSFSKISDPEDLAAKSLKMKALYNNEIDYFRLEKIFLHKHGHEVWGALNVSLVRDEKGSPCYYIFQIEDISSRKLAETQVEHLIQHDSLTGMPTRDLLEAFIIKSLLVAYEKTTLFGVIFLDIDHFKRINNALGHEVGDLLLQAIGQRLCASISTEDFAARLGGDTFVLVVTAMSKLSDIINAVRKIQLCFADPFVINNQDYHMTVSIGASVFPDNGTNSKTLIKNGDTALNLAKKTGRNTFQFCNSQMTTNILNRVNLEKKLHSALNKNEFTLYYQPQVSLADGKIVGVEALLRWKQSDGIPTLPKDLISIAEETGLIIPIGEWVIQTACEQAKKWKTAGINLNCVSINLSARQFYETNLLNTLSKINQKYGLTNIDLEITESLLMRDMDLAIKQLVFLHEAGFQVSLDDFGTGYSSLAYIRQFPINRLKIDQIFIRDSVINAQHAALLKAIIILGQTLSLNVIAEGVETAEQLKLLKEFGCNEMQGYYFSKPIPAEDVTKLLLENKRLFTDI